MSEVASSAHVHMTLAVYASIDASGKINIIGGGITVLGIDAAAGVAAPHAIVAVVTFRTEFIGESPPVELALEHDDGSIVAIPGAIGPFGEPQLLRVGAADPLKAPVSMVGANVPYDAIRPRAQFVMHFGNGLPLAPGRGYTWRIKVDHDTRDEWSQVLRPRRAR